MMDLEKWDDELVMKMDNTTLCKLIVTCDYLNIPKIQDLVSRRCVDKIKKKTMTLCHNSRSLSLPISMKEYE